MKKIVYLDVDGTILNKEGKLPKLNQEVLIEIQKQGIGVVLATGRNFKEIQHIAHQLEINKYLNYAILENGAYITPTDKLKPIYLHPIDETDVKKLYEYLTNKGITIFISTYKNQDFAYSNLHEKSMELQKNLNQVLPKFEIKPADENLDWSAVTMIAFDAEPNEAKLIENYFEKHFPNIEALVSRSAHRVKPLFMINAKNITKATAIKYLNKQLKINNENTYFFGDGINDIPAIKTFKNSFTPSSAPDYVKDVAQNLIEPASDAGVGKKLQELFLNKNSK